MNYLNEAANGTEGNFTDRCVDQLKQATADNAAWNEANLQLNSALAAARNDRDVAYHHLGNATTELRQSQNVVEEWKRRYASLTDIQDKYVEERDEARTSLRQMREDRDFVLGELKVAKQKIAEQDKELNSLYLTARKQQIEDKLQIVRNHMERADAIIRDMLRGQT